MTLALIEVFIWNSYLMCSLSRETSFMDDWHISGKESFFWYFNVSLGTRKILKTLVLLSRDLKRQFWVDDFYDGCLTIFMTFHRHTEIIFKIYSINFKNLTKIFVNIFLKFPVDLKSEKKTDLFSSTQVKSEKQSFFCLYFNFGRWKTASRRVIS